MDATSLATFWALVSLLIFFGVLFWLKVPAKIGAARISFGKPELLMEIMGLTPGSVTPFALMNDAAAKRLTVIVDDGHPPGGKVAYGATVAVPSFHRVAEKLIGYLNIRPPGGSPLGGQRLALQGGGR